MGYTLHCILRIVRYIMHLTYCILYIIVQLGLGFKLNTKIGLHTHTNFLKGSRPSRRLRFGMLTLLTKIRSSAEEKQISPNPPPPKKRKICQKKISPLKKN